MGKAGGTTIESQPQNPSHSHRDRASRYTRTVRLALGAASVVAIGAFATAWLFVWPPSASPKSADAVVVLSGDHGERLPLALDLLRSGVSKVFVHAGDRDSPEARALCQGGQPFEVVCLDLQPDSTRIEARAVGDLARERGWRTIVVVTSSQHATRAGLAFRRCVDGTVEVVHDRAKVPRRTLAVLIRSEWLKVAYSVMVNRDC